MSRNNHRRFNESTTERATRLKAEGRFVAFRSRIDEKVAGGMTKAAADWEAWGEFPPLDAPEPAPAPPPPEPPPEPSEEAPTADEPTVDVGKAIFDAYAWVFLNVDAEVETDYTGPAPRGAMGLMKQARDDPQWFYRDVARAMLPSRGQIEAMGKFVDDDRNIRDRLTTIGARAQGLQAGSEAGVPVLLGSAEVAP